MNAKELMICDLVIYEDNIHKITDLSLCIDESVLVHVDGYECHIFEHEISPIPLTKEILKANGFWEEGGGFAKFFPGVGKFTTWKSRIEDIQCTLFGTVELPLRYVHQLQHALRLCGLQELADNFKVKL